MNPFGVHIDPPLAVIPQLLNDLGLNTFQTTLRNPVRLSKEGVPEEADCAAFRQEAKDLWGIVHASMLTSLGSPDPRIRNGSLGALTADANLAAALGLAGVCFHVGYEKGHDTRDAAHAAVVRKLSEGLPKLKPGARVLLENGAEGTELGQTIAELGTVARGCGADPSVLGIVLDTCHLHVSGFDMADPDAPKRLADEVEAEGLAPLLTALHLNDAKFACGSRRDRHAVPGQGTIGEGLVRLLQHPMFSGLPCILELDTASAMEGISWLRSHLQQNFER
jgi:deoxyribonuclease-4